ncbi:disease resistance protein (TIR-NBS-LRR class) family [Artemisia annua]|uniref:Disease resistance protein (TIR-NBS-LRR class) family n=1 Tax=Artemisia annua TaxID=35608 RepID=A0A2U1LQX6_ARTAN|nr:disease resistance protein (TIR-NBS-LRR class) family [Artemisia annua]
MTSCKKLKCLPSRLEMSSLEMLILTSCESLERFPELSPCMVKLSHIDLSSCNELLEDEENERYLDKMLKQSFLKKYAAVDSCFSICVPRSMIPSWFKEKRHGCTIALKLHPQWQTEIMGFAICGVFRSRRVYYEPTMELRFENYRMHAPMPQFDYINTSSGTHYEKLWIAYVPFSLFEQLNDDDKRWSHIIEGNLVISLSCSHSQSATTRCGAQAVYKEKTDSVQQIEPSIPYWKWKLSQRYQNIRISLDYNV